MALQLGALRDALIDAGASEDKAQRAAEELAGYQSEFAAVRGVLNGIDARLNGVDARITMLTWVITLHAAVTLAILGSTFALWAKLGDISGQLAQIARAVSH